MKSGHFSGSDIFTFYFFKHNLNFEGNFYFSKILISAPVTAKVQKLVKRLY